ncbi:MAG: hypothetical protein O2812_03860 [Chloroflexi bacterium]|nr:hypothetical protein [Chloroflexota bacterium]
MAAEVVTEYAKLTGAGTVFTKQSWGFPRPVSISDTIRAEATVPSVHPRLPIADVGFKITNQDGEEVLMGEATVYQAIAGLFHASARPSAHYPLVW